MQRVVQVGVGGYGTTWLSTILAARDRVRHVRLVDSDPVALDAARAAVGLDRQHCFAVLDEALDACEAGIVLCVVPPEHHEAVIVPALRAGRHVLCEKPVAASLDASRRIVAACRASTGSLTIAQKGRYHAWVRRTRAALAAGEIGQITHATLHYRAPLFRWGESGFRHRMADPLLVEMSIHHFDLLRALLGRDAVAVAGQSWNWPTSGFAGDVAASLTFTMDGDLPVIYEANCISSGDLTSWYGDLRIEGDRGCLTMIYPRLYIARRGATQAHVAGVRQDLEVVDDSHGGQATQLHEYLDAVEAGRPAETAIDDNQHTMAMLFAAIAACHTGTRQTIADFV